jgi:hypothetical protein
MDERTSRQQVDTPGKDIPFPALQEVEVTDPTHPLFGRRFPLLATSTTLTGLGYAWVVYRDDVQLRLQLAATDLGVSSPRVPTKFTPEAIAELLALAGRSEDPCLPPPATSGVACPTSSDAPSPTSSPPSSRR